MKPAQLVAMILTLLLVYALSPGPIRVWYSHRPPGGVPKAVMTFYAPLEWLYENNAGVKVAYQSYFQLLGL
jgi:hypothetical protein